MEAIKVFVVEDNYHLREGLTHLINGTQGFQCVGAFGDAFDILHHIKRASPHVVLMDIDIPGTINGLEATFLVKQHFPEMIVLIQTVFEDKAKIFDAIKGGASGYILKSTPPAKLLEAIQEVATGGSVMSPSIAYKTLEMFRSGQVALPSKSPSTDQLSERQKEILQCIIDGKSYKMIGSELFISIDTVKFHVKNIYEILQIHSRHELSVRFRK